jgi:hypothetical protein
MSTRQTIFSRDRIYRYTLWREWDLLLNPSYLMVIGLNPSTADETEDDPTIRRCVDFAKRFGYGALCMTNLFAFRSTDPKGLKATRDPIGPENDAWLCRMAFANDCGMVIAAWGSSVKTHLAKHSNRIAVSQRDKNVFAPGLLNLKTVHCLGFNADGSPKHPLYLPANTQPELYYPL